MNNTQPTHLLTLNLRNLHVNIDLTRKSDYSMYSSKREQSIYRKPLKIRAFQALVDNVDNVNIFSKANVLALF